MAFILATLYRSSLMARLILPKVDIYFNNLAELVEQHKYKWYLLRYSSLEKLFQTAAPGSIHRRVYDGMEDFVDVSRNGFKKLVNSDDMVYLLEELGIQGAMEYFYRPGICPFTVSKEIFVQNFLHGIAFQKGSKHSYVKEVNRILQALRSSGILNKWSRDFRLASRCYTPPESTVVDLSIRPLQLQHLYGILSLYVAGMCLALGVLLCEVLLGYTTESIYKKKVISSSQGQS